MDRVNDYYEAVDDDLKKEAITILRQRIKSENKHLVLGMSKENDFYIDKLISGKMPISRLLYERITGRRLNR